MITYNPDIHTPEALDAEIGRIYSRTPDALLVGSLGRAAAFGKAGYSPLVEFDYRSQNPLFTGNKPRDIDVVDGVGAKIKDSPFIVDSTVFNCPRVSLVREGTDWYLHSPAKRFTAPLHPAVMEPIASETVHGIPCVTVPLATHLALLGLKGRMSPKVLQTRELITQLGGSNERTKSEIYRPFDELRALDTRGIYPLLQRYYHNLLPEHIRYFLLPISRPLKNLLP